MHASSAGLLKFPYTPYQSCKLYNLRSLGQPILSIHSYILGRRPLITHVRASGSRARLAARRRGPFNMRLEVFSGGSEAQSHCQAETNPTSCLQPKLQRGCIGTCWGSLPLGAQPVHTFFLTRFHEFRLIIVIQAALQAICLLQECMCDIITQQAPCFVTSICQYLHSGHLDTSSISTSGN